MNDQDLIQGDWRVVKVIDGADEYLLEGMNDYVFRGDQYSTLRSPQTQPATRRGTEHTFKLDPLHSPKQIDLTLDGVTLKGIYALDGDNLKVSIHFGERPESFDHSNSKVVVLERRKRSIAAR